MPTLEINIRLQITDPPTRCRLTECNQLHFTQKEIDRIKKACQDAGTNVILCTVEKHHHKQLLIVDQNGTTGSVDWRFLEDNNNMTTTVEISLVPYLVFTGNTEYPEEFEGWNSYRSSHTKLDAAIEHAKDYLNGTDNWAQIVDLETQQIIWNGYETPNPSKTP